MNIKLLIVAALASGLAVSNAEGQVRHHTQNQHQRITQGVRSGKLTKAEAKDLREDQKDMQRDRKLAKADGKITRRERRLLKKEEHKNNREIYRKKHNRRERH